MILLQIGSTDYTPKVVKKSYEMNRKDETESWLDGNARKHTTVVRTRVEGKATLVFSTEAEHQAFVSNLASSCDDGYWEIVVYVADIHDQQTITARIEVDTKAVFGNLIVNGLPIVNSVTLDIEEV